jgi:hypothetical protein
MIELIIVFLLNSIFNILTFYVMNSIVEKKSINPAKKIEEAVQRKKVEKEIKDEQSKIDKMLQNIDNYDGTSRGQQDIK